MGSHVCVIGRLDTFNWMSRQIAGYTRAHDHISLVRCWREIDKSWNKYQMATTE